MFGEDAIYQLHFIDAQHFDVTVMADPSYPKGTLNHFEVSMTEVRPDVYMGRNQTRAVIRFDTD